MAPDEQDQAEQFDETHVNDDGDDIASGDMRLDVPDFTAAAGDAAEDEASDDFDPDAADDAEIDEMLERDDGVDEVRTFAHDPADLTPDPTTEERLDEALKESFPASDSVAIDTRSR